MKSELIQELLAGPLEALGFNIVQVLISGSEKKVLEIMIERLDEQPVSINDCKLASKEASAHLDVEDAVQSAYILEVTSPGIDRPLIKKEDFEKHSGKFVRITTSQPIDGRKKFKGKLISFNDDKAIVEIDQEGAESKQVEIIYSNITKANLSPKFDGIKILYS